MPARGWVLIGLGLSLLLAAVAVAYFSLAGRPLFGFAVAVLVVLVGLWEYRRKLADVRTAARLEAESRD